jgi:CRISPR/Cas system-associated protein Csm6
MIFTFVKTVFPYISRSVLYENFTVQLGYRKFCATWVPRMLTEEHQVKEIVTDWLNGLAADSYNEGIVKLVQRLNKRLTRNGD